MRLHLLFGVAAAAMVLVITPASAQTVVRDSTCTVVAGSNRMTYDCGFNVMNYALGAPVTLNVTWTCTGTCGPATAFGLRQNPFSPAGVSGHLMGAHRLDDGFALTFVFDSLKSMGGGPGVGNARFSLTVDLDDGTGTIVPVPCKVDVHLNG
jgi:hypothetical protein